MGLEEVLAGYRRKMELVDTLQERRRELEAELDRAWGEIGVVDAIAVPLAEALLPLLPADAYETFGPFGLSAETSIYFTARGVRVASLTFLPFEAREGRLTHVTYRSGRPVREAMPEGLDDIASLARENAAEQESQE